MSQPIDLSGDRQAFIDTLLPAAIEESQRTGVDPRIIVAQAAQETGWGKSAPGNNYFGIKSHGQGGGQTLATNEVINGKTVRINDSFRTFDSPTDSVRGYGDFILQNPRYRPLREAQGLDAQLDALQASGYATDPNYSRSVGSIARSIQLPNPEVAALTPEAAIEAVAPGSGSVAPPAPAFDAGRFGDPMNLAEMPPSAAQLPGALVEQGAAYAPQLPPPTVIEERPVSPVVDALVASGAPSPSESSPAGQRVAQALIGSPAGERRTMNSDYFPAAPNPVGQAGPSMQQITQALGNPFLNPGQRAVAEILLRQQVQGNDPLRQLQIEKLRREVAQGPNSGESFFGNPIAVQNPDGSIAYGQIGNKGSFRPIQLGEGQSFAPPTRTVDTGTETIMMDQAGNVISRTPKQNYQESYEKAQGGVEGKSRGEATTGLSAGLMQAERTIQQIDQLIEHPGLSSVVGPLDQFRPTWALGAQGNDALARLNQLQGGAFLQAFEMLKGGGQITEVEGVKAEQAQARMARAQSEAEFKAALRDFRDAVQQGAQKLREKAGSGATGSRGSGNPASTQDDPLGLRN